jgi:lipid A 3-O-deacylase
MSTLLQSSGAVRLGLSALALMTAQTAFAQHPADQWEVALEAGYLEKVRNNTPLDYTIAPVQVAWRSPAFATLWQNADGMRLNVRHRIALVAETFIEGAEDYYVGFAAAPTFELWMANGRTAVFYEIGGGAGFVNSQGVTGGQGQDFTFNWFTQLGLRQQIQQKLAVSGGLYFTHHSNLGLTDPNPGIDVLGLNLGIIWTLD